MEEREFLMQTVTPADVAGALGVSERIVYLWMAKGNLAASQHVNGRWTVRVDDCHNFIARLKRRVDKEALRKQFDDALRTRLSVDQAEARAS
jgi:hypothetical protein